MKKDKELNQKEEELGYYANIVQELRMEDTDGFKEMVRMVFKLIWNLIEPDITPQEIVGGNKVISVAESLTLTIRVLVLGESVGSLSFQFCSNWRILCTIKWVCNTIEVHSSTILKCPLSIRRMSISCREIRKSLPIRNITGTVNGKYGQIITELL